MPPSSTPRKKSSQNNNNVVSKRSKGRQRVAFSLPARPCIVGRALVCGQGDMGQLGLGDNDSNFERKRPALLEAVTNVVDVCAGGMHNLVLTHEGRVYSFGCNDEGALGRDSSAEGSEFEPIEIELPGRVLRISAGDSHSACLLEDGRVFAWGSFRDSHGNMGLTLEGNKREPIDILPDTKCCDIASGADHLVMLTCAGKVVTVGCAEQGQLGRISKRSISGEGRHGKTDLLRPGEVVMVKHGKPIDAIWATNYCTFLRESQTQRILAFGLNNYKQLVYPKDDDFIVSPIETKLTDVRQIAGGQHHTLVLKNDGRCYVIGRRDYGRLGLGALTDDVTELQPITALDGKKIVSVSCGEAQSFALTESGQLYAWGMGSNHQLGTGSEDDVLEPVLIVSKQTKDKRIIRASSGGQHSIFLVEDEVQPPKANKQAKQQQEEAETNAKETKTEAEKPTAVTKEKEKKVTKRKAASKVDELLQDDVEVQQQEPSDAGVEQPTKAKETKAPAKRDRKK